MSFCHVTSTPQRIGGSQSWVFYSLNKINAILFITLSSSMRGHDLQIAAGWHKITILILVSLILFGSEMFTFDICTEVW